MNNSVVWKIQSKATMPKADCKFINLELKNAFNKKKLKK